MRKMKKPVVLVIVLTLLFSLLSVSVSADTGAGKSKSNRYNVCFVLDSTKSLNVTDKDGIRYDAVDLFVALLANKGNHVGSVSFSKGIIKQNDMMLINGPDDKRTIEQGMRTDIKEGATTIGIALETAVNMLISQGDPTLPSIVLLMSDGQSVKDNEEEEKSLGEGIAQAQTNGIQVYTIALNSDPEQKNVADVDVLERIAKATGGQCEEVKDAEDLVPTFQMFYSMIYGVQPEEIIHPTPIPSTGMIETDFFIPFQGVEEFNIIISIPSGKKLDRIMLTRPDGTDMDEGELRSLTTDANRYSITKITDPVGGQWHFKGEGDEGTEVSVNMLYNDTITVETEPKSFEAMYGLNDSVTISGYVLDDGQRLTSGYNDYTARLVPDSQNGKEIQMSISGNSFEGTITFDKEGTYLYHMVVEGNGLTKTTPDKEIELNVGNFPPKLRDGLKTEDFQKHFMVFPLFTKTGEFDLAALVEDPDGDPLTFEVINTPYKDTTYEISDGTLVIKDFYDLSKAVSTIRVSDDKGGILDFDVTTSQTNVGIIALIVIGVALLAVIAFILLKLRHDYLLKFSGTINIATGGEANVSVTSFAPLRGRCPLSYFGATIPGLDTSKVYFQATGKSHILLKSNKKNLYVAGSGLPFKQVTINGNGSEMRIMAQPDSENCFYISFESLLNTTMGSYY